MAGTARPPAEQLPPGGGGRQLLGGTVKVFVADLLVVPSGLLTAAYLTRALGPERYGLFVLAVTIVVSIQWTIVTALSHPTVKFVSDARDWRPVGTTATQLYLAGGLGAALLLVALAGPLAVWLHAPPLAEYLPLLALEIPLFCLAQAHQQVLVGLGAFAQRAAASAARWTSRLVLIVLLVHLGMGVRGAIMGSVAASGVELLAARWFVRPPLLRRSVFPAGRMWGYIVPLLLLTVSVRAFDKMDLVLLKALGGTAAQAGFYGAAQNLSLLPILFASTFASLLLAALSRADRDGDQERVRRLSAGAMRAILWLLPLVAIVAGSADALVTLFFGGEFAPAAPLLAVLTGAAVLRAVVVVDTAVLTAVGRPRWTLGIAVPMVPLALLGHLLLIPVGGPLGAAGVTAGVAGVAALVSNAAARRAVGIRAPIATLLRCGAAALVGYAAAAAWPAEGALLLVKLPAIVGLTGGVLLLLGEISARDAALARSLLLSRG